MSTYCRTPHAVKGESIYAFVTLSEEAQRSGNLLSIKKELIAHVRKHIGAFAAPDVIHWAPGLPKTRCVPAPFRVPQPISGILACSRSIVMQWAHKALVMVQCCTDTKHICGHARDRCNTGYA